MEKGPEIATLHGEQCVLDHGMGALPIDPMAIANAAEIEVVEKSAKPGVSGMLIRAGDKFAIAYGSHVSVDGFRRFSVAHELGHYFLAGHIDHVLGSGGFHESRAGFTSGDRYEREADLFAVGLLMPRALFNAAIGNAGDGLDAVEHLATTCRTSLTATAKRFAELTSDAVAVVITNQEEIEFVEMSKTFRELDVTWLKRGDPIPRRTLTSRFNGDPGRILHGDRERGTSDLETWFTSHGENSGLLEEVIGLGRYEKTLTVLSVQGAVDEEDAEEDKALIESWTPTLGRSRRR